MRPLTDEEAETFYKKLSQYIGTNLKALIERTDETYCFRYHDDRVYYVSESILTAASNYPRDDIMGLGVCFGKFTKTKKFMLKITCLEYLAEHAKHKVWVKPSSEMSFLYGNHVVKAGVARMSEDVPQYAGVVVFSLANIPLGFGAAAQSTDRARDMDPTGIAVLHQADIGEYLREETTLL